MEPHEVDARRVHDLIRSGGLALACTDTGYGFVAMRAGAVRRIYELKGRPAEKPCVTVGTLRILDDVADGITPDVRRWLAGAIALWPIALIARANPRSRLLGRLEPEVAAQSMKEGTIATFYGVGPVISRVAELALAHDELVVGSSANRSGTGNNYCLDDVPAEIRDAVDLVIEGAPRCQSPARLASSILDVTTGTFLRRGVYADDIEHSWFRHARAS